MARSQRSTKLETRTARLKLPQGKRQFVTIGEGLAIAYRRTWVGYGTWQARVWDGAKYHYRNLGTADDFLEANGVDILTFYQAQDKARKVLEDAKVSAGKVIVPLTVSEAANRYLTWYRIHRRAHRETEHSVRAHILPVLGPIHIDALTSSQIRTWLDTLAAMPARVRSKKHSVKATYRAPALTEDEKRARRASANRILNVLKAMLNSAFHNGLVADDSSWRKVKPFPKVDEARIRFLDDAQAARLCRACPPDLRALVRAALLTGARHGELAALRTQDVNIRDEKIYIAQSKSGRPRHIPLNKEGVALFHELLTESTGDTLVFKKANGKAWGKNHHARPLKAASKVAKIDPAIKFHELRHTYASHLAQAGVDLLTISKLLGHADTRITSKHYAHLADRTLAAAVTKLPNFFSPSKKRKNS